MPDTSRPSTSAARSVSIAVGDPDHRLHGHGAGDQGRMEPAEWLVVRGEPPLKICPGRAGIAVVR